MADLAGADPDPDPSNAANVWCVVTHHLDDEPWWRFTVDATGPGGPVRTHTVSSDEVIAALQVWLTRTVQSR